MQIVDEGHDINEPLCEIRVASAAQLRAGGRIDEELGEIQIVWALRCWVLARLEDDLCLVGRRVGDQDHPALRDERFGTFG